MNNVYVITCHSLMDWDVWWMLCEIHEEEGTAKERVDYLNQKRIDDTVKFKYDEWKMWPEEEHTEWHHEGYSRRGFTE